MNENECEMIEEMAKDLVGEIDYGTADYGDGYDSWTEVYFDYNETAKNMVEKGYRKVADDEIVVKKSEYKELKKYRTDWLNSEKMHLQAELEDTEFELGCSNRLFQKVCEEKKELEKQLEQVKQETARAILALIGKPNYKGDDWYEGAFYKQEQIREQIADIYGIELED